MIHRDGEATGHDEDGVVECKPLNLSARRTERQTARRRQCPRESERADRIAVSERRSVCGDGRAINHGRTDASAQRRQGPRGKQAKTDENLIVVVETNFIARNDIATHVVARQHRCQER